MSNFSWHNSAFCPVKNLKKIRTKIRNLKNRIFPLSYFLLIDVDLVFEVQNYHDREQQIKFHTYARWRSRALALSFLPHKFYKSNLFWIWLESTWSNAVVVVFFVCCFHCYLCCCCWCCYSCYFRCFHCCCCCGKRCSSRLI